MSYQIEHFRQRSMAALGLALTTTVFVLIALLISAL